MQNFGLQQVAANAQPIQFATGVGWEYIRIRNESPLELNLNFTGMGSTSLAPWQRDDFFIGPTQQGRLSSYTGAVQITGSLQSSASGNPSSYVVCDAYRPGELPQPLSVDLTRLTSIGNTVNTVGTTPTNVNNSGNNLGTRFIQAETSGDSVNQASVQLFNNGVAWLGQSALPLLAATRGAYLSIFEFPGDNSEVITGQTSGTVTVYQPLRGDLKMVVAVSNNYKNTGTQTVAIPVPFTSRYFFFVGDTGGATTHVGFLLSGVAQSMIVITTLNAAGGGATVQAFSAPNSFGESHAGCDTLQYLLNSGASNGIIVMIGQ